MIFARVLCAERTEDLQLGFDRMGLPASAREYLFERIPHFQILLTGLEPHHTRFIKQKIGDSQAPAKEEYPAFTPGDARIRPGTALLSGRRDQMDALLQAAKLAPEQAALAAAIERALEPNQAKTFLIGSRRFNLGEGALLMGVVNVTPDSFSDGGSFLDPARAVEHGKALVEAGADLLDVGGESTRPGAQAVNATEELGRIVPVIRGLIKAVDVPISVDTYKAEVAGAALAEGAAMVNDISGFRFDPQMAGQVAKAKAACALMHIRGTPLNMQLNPHYEDLLAEVYEYLDASITAAVSAGVQREKICVDPGIGFGKTAEHSLFLLRRLSEFRSLGVPILVGTSRKSFLGKLTGRNVDQRLPATLASVAVVAANQGADIVRVHDVAEAKDAIKVASAICQARGAGTLGSPRSVLDNG